VKTYLLVCVLAILAACTQQPAPVVYEQPAAQQVQAAPAAAPVVVQAAPAQDSGPGFWTGAIMGGLLGHALGSNGSSAAPAPRVVQHTTVVHQTVVNKTVNVTKPAAPPPAPKPATPPVAAAPKPSLAPRSYSVPTSTTYRSSYSGSAFSGSRRK